MPFLNRFVPSTISAQDFPQEDFCRKIFRKIFTGCKSFSKCYISTNQCLS